MCVEDEGEEDEDEEDGELLTVSSGNGSPGESWYWAFFEFAANVERGLSAVGLITPTMPQDVQASMAEQ